MAAVDDALAWQQQQIQNFQNNMPQYQQQGFAQIQDQGNQGLTQQNKAIDQNYNARGLLYSGMKQQAKANAGATAASGVATNEASFNNQLNNQNYQNQMAGTNSQLTNYDGANQAALAQYGQNLQQNTANTGMLGSLGLGTAMYLGSDENLKENVESGDKDISDFLDKLSVNKYDYKEPDKYGEGKQYSTMAQDLEKTPVGKSMVVDTPDGKMVDYARGLASMLAAQSFLHKKIKSLEESA